MNAEALKERCLMFCEECKERSKCIKVCKELENYLNREQSKKGYSFRHIRRKEIPYDPDLLDEFLPKKMIDKRFGNKKPKYTIDNQ